MDSRNRTRIRGWNNVIISVGSVAGPDMVLSGETVEVIVGFTPAMPDGDYKLGYSVAATASILGCICVLGVTQKTNNDCTILIKNDGPEDLNLAELIIDVVVIKTVI